MKKKILTAVVILIILTIVQLITYQTMAREKLSEQAIKHIEVTTPLASDTIIFSTAISIRGSQQETITPYKLNLLNKENFRRVRTKLSPSVVVEETEYENYCNTVSKKAVANLDSAQFAFFTRNLYEHKSRLYITALEEQKFRVTVSYNWSANREFFYEENTYIWLFFSWLKI